MDDEESVDGEEASVEPLSARLVSDAVVYPTIRVASRPGQLLMGVYDGDGAYVDGTVLDRRSGEQGAPVPRDLYAPVTGPAEPEAIYAGPLYYHFGHFLLESLARTWYAQRHPEVPLVWAGQHSWQGFTMAPWQSEILELLGLTNPTRILVDPTRFDLLHVPDIGYRYDDRFHPEHAAFLGRYQGPDQVPGSRLWLSRTKIDSEVRDLNGGATERWLTKEGWRIIHPEGVSVREQLDALGAAENVAGEEGSAFHAIVLLADVAAKKFHVLRRHGAEHRNMHTVGDARHVDQTFSSVERQVVLQAQGRVVSKISPSSADVLEVLGVPVHEAAVPEWADPIISRVLDDLGPQRLLDVGATSSQPVVRSAAPVRVAVSRRLDVDPRVLAPAGVEVYELGLEEYADLFHGKQEPFDVIRIAGNKLDEVMESFRASTGLADESTVWVLGCGRFAARVALAVRLLHPGYTVLRVLVQRKIVFVVRRAADEPSDVRAVKQLSAAEVSRRLRWVRPVRLQRLREATTGSRPADPPTS
ncbi:MAG: glycosyltransferase 61 family protein [Janthinobacterium lividum]